MYRTKIIRHIMGFFYEPDIIFDWTRGNGSKRLTKNQNQIIFIRPVRTKKGKKSPKTLTETPLKEARRADTQLLKDS